MKYKHTSLEKAVSYVIQKNLKDIGGRGGCIAIDRKGNIVMSFTTSGMFRGYIDTKGVHFTALYAD